MELNDRAPALCNVSTLSVICSRLKGAPEVVVSSLLNVKSPNVCGNDESDSKAAAAVAPTSSDDMSMFGGKEDQQIEVGHCWT